MSHRKLALRAKLSTTFQTCHHSSLLSFSVWCPVKGTRKLVCADSIFVAVRDQAFWLCSLSTSLGRLLAPRCVSIGFGPLWGSGLAKSLWSSHSILCAGCCGGVKEKNSIVDCYEVLYSILAFEALACGSLT